MLDDDYNLKLIDFGNAKLESSAENEDLIKTISEKTANSINANLV